MKRTSVVLLAVMTILGARVSADVRKEVSMWVARDVAPGPKVRLTLNTRNVAVVQMAAYRVSDIALLTGRENDNKLPAPSGSPVRQWSVSLVNPKQARSSAQRDVYRSRQVNLPPLAPGAYLLIARGGDKDARSLVNVTDLAVVVKRSSTQILTWVTDAANGRVISGARVTVYRRIPHTTSATPTNYPNPSRYPYLEVGRLQVGIPGGITNLEGGRLQVGIPGGITTLEGGRLQEGIPGGIKEQTTYTFDVLSSSATGRDGACVIKTPPGQDLAVVVSRGHDLAVFGCEKATGDGVLVSHFQTDRPIYRPGQTVFYKVILRRTQGRGYTPVTNTACAVQIRDPEDNVVDKTSVTTNAIGTLSGRFDVPSEGAVGPYSIVVTAGEQDAYDTFSVAEYRKPESEVKVRPVEPRYLSGQEIAFAVSATYYFGAPLQQASVSYKVRRSGTAYWGESAPAWWASDDGNLYPRDTYRSNDFIAEGTVYTDDSGNVTIPIKTRPGTPDSTYTIQCNVQDASRRQVEASASVPVYAAGLRIGMQTDIVCAPLGSNIPVRVSVVDLDGKPAPAKVRIEIQGQVWDRKAGDYKPKSFGTTTVDVPASGKATAKVPAKTEGDLAITATAVDNTGRKTGASIWVWVAGPSTKMEKESGEPTVAVKLDRQSYAPGATVKAWVSTNTLDRPLLVTAEGRDIWRYTVLPPGRSINTFALKTTLEMSPNAFIEAAQWTRSGLVSGGAEVPIPDETRKLDVRIEPERKTYRPGESAAYLIHTQTQDGKPVSAEVAVCVVDEAIYALRADATPDLLKTFWGARPNRVVTNSSAPEEVSGGAYQRVSSLAPVRQRFVDTAYWNAHVTTDANGTARISFETPGNLTTWRATARAITSDTRVGSATATAQASRPVMLRLAAPRQFVKGDRLTLIGTVTNRSGAPHEFETAISAVGVRIEGETTKKVQVPAGAQGTVEWTVFADTIPETGLASLTARTLASDAAPDQGEELSDALKVDVRVVPGGIVRRLAEGGSMSREKTVVVNLPPDRIEPASTVKVAIRLGLKQVVADLAESALQSGRCGSLGAADELLAISIAGPALRQAQDDLRQAQDASKETREALAAVCSAQAGHNGAWGWWRDAANPEITAAVLTDLVRSRARGIAVPDRVMQRGADAAVRMFGEENLWERAALLASAATLAGCKDSAELLGKVHEKGRPLSPFAQLSLAEAYLGAGKKEWARECAGEALANAVVGPEVAYIPAGDHLGWEATTVETTAQALIAAIRLGVSDDLQPKLAGWLAGEGSRGWLSQHETALAAFALDAYAAGHPQSASLGALEVSVNGTLVEPGQEKLGIIRAVIPSNLLRDGDNTFVLRRDQPGEVFYSVEARVYRPATDETSEGARVLRRYEVKNRAGLWDEANGDIKASEPVRCTVVVWPNDRPDALRVVEPIPSGFEFIDSDYTGRYDREEVRDGAVIHYFQSDGRPIFFRYYLRAESEGMVTALPAMAEALRRPTVRGNSQLTTLTVGK